MPKQKPEDALAAEIAKVLRQFQPGGKFAPIEDRTEFEQVIKSLPPEEQELTRELTNHADLLRYFAERNMKTGSDIADAMFAAAKLPVPERTDRIREINRVLMERLNHADQSDGLRN
jgi:guanyl-specific ribonuclease Sa